MLYHVALHTGDDNDNSITRFDMEAESKEKLFERLEREFFDDFRGPVDEVIEDGDGDSLTLMWFDGDIPYHHDFYIESD